MSIRVLIVDDSSFVRDVLQEVLRPFPDISVVGAARDGREASKMLLELKPDVITMDVLMPMMGGLETVANIMRTTPVPILIVADTQSSDKLLQDALAAGAVGVFAKPTGGFTDDMVSKLVSAIRKAACSNTRAPAPPIKSDKPLALARISVLGIVSSTGGPQTLASFLSGLPSTVPIPICIVQHTTTGFTENLVSWLDSACHLPVLLAKEGARLRAGEVIIAAEDRHLQITSAREVHLSESEPITSLRPSGNVMLESLARTYHRRSAGLVCTGMGNDGSTGLQAIFQAGGTCMVQDPETAVLDSMPRNAGKQVPAAASVNLAELAKSLRELWS